MTVATTLTPEQIAALAWNAGWRGDDLTTAVAVALAESRGGDPAATNLKGFDRSYGLWQVNLHPNAHAGRWQPDWLLNPANNAQAAYAIYSEAKGWQPWGAYTDDSYRQYLPRAAQAAGAVSASATPVKWGDWWLPDNVPGIGEGSGLGDAMADAMAAAARAVGLDNLAEKALSVALGVVFTAAALGLIAMGLFRLTGSDPKKLLSAAGSATTGAGLVAAAASV